MGRMFLKYQEDTKLYVLEVETDNITKFKDDLMCAICHKKIGGFTPYYCPDNKIFFHKHCLLSEKDKHKKIYDREGQHYDHPVVIVKMK